DDEPNQHGNNRTKSIRPDLRFLLLKHLKQIVHLLFYATALLITLPLCPLLRSGSFTHETGPFLLLVMNVANQPAYVPTGIGVGSGQSAGGRGVAWSGGCARSRAR